MKSDKAKPILLQLVFITLLSAAASYVFQHTVTAYKIDEICVYRYVAYAFTVLIVYIAFSRYKKYVGLAFSLVLSVVALSPIRQNAIQFFPLLTPLFALLLGVTTIVVVPSLRGKGYFEFLVMLIVPAVLAESRIGGSVRLLATTESVGYGVLSAVVACVVGGYFYLRYSNLAGLGTREFLGNGISESDALKAELWSNSVTVLVVACASCMALILMTIAPILADVVRFTMLGLSAYLLGLAIGAGILIIAIIHILRRQYRESS